MSAETEAIPTLRSRSVHDRVSLLLCAVAVLGNPAARELVAETVRRFPHAARPQVLQQAILDLMVYAAAQNDRIPAALLPVAAMTRGALEEQIGSANAAPLPPYVTAWSGLIEALFPEMTESDDPRSLA